MKSRAKVFSQKKSFWISNELAADDICLRVKLTKLLAKTLLPLIYDNDIKKILSDFMCE